MSELDQLLNLPKKVMQSRGVVFTPREIARQPEVWPKAARAVLTQAPRIASFFSEHLGESLNQSRLILSGAGSSEYAAESAKLPLSDRTAAMVFSAPSTSLLAYPRPMLAPEAPSLLVSIARSGNSPESMAVYELYRRGNPDRPHIGITCSVDSELFEAAKRDPHSLFVVLPPETNDQSLVMTSSFTSLVLSLVALGWLDDPETYQQAVAKAAESAQDMLETSGDNLARIAKEPFDRVVYLGDGAHFGAMQESSLKMVEMTSGSVPASAFSHLGFRHGPQVLANKSCLIVSSLSPVSYVRQYQLDLLTELRRKNQGYATIAITDAGLPFDDSLCDLRVVRGTAMKAPGLGMLHDTMVGQLLALHKCLNLGLKPDNPSESGTIHRVVERFPTYQSQYAW